MRTLRLLAFIVVIATFGNRACLARQDAFGKRKVFEGGIIGGFNISKVDGDTYPRYGKVGIQAGGEVYVHFTPVWGMSMELLYSQKGARGGNVKESLYLGTYIDKYYLNLNYVEVPLMLHFKMGSYIDYEGGFAYDRLIKSKEWAEADVPVQINPLLNYFNSESYEYVLGVTVQLGRHWYGDIRYEYSLKPIRTWDRVPVRYMQYGVNEYNNVVILRMIYRI